jgi:hypothetical protein
MLYVRSLDHGFVTNNRFSCNKDCTVSEDEFLALELSIRCRECRTPMIRTILRKDYNNRAFQCSSCRVVVLFADILPHYLEVKR